VVSQCCERGACTLEVRSAHVEAAGAFQPMLSTRVNSTKQYLARSTGVEALQRSTLCHHHTGDPLLSEYELNADLILAVSFPKGSFPH
jgi:hypothetical protein